jgi:DNA primase
MTNELLVNLVSKVLGQGKQTARGNRAFHCPLCNHSKPKLEINFTDNKKGYHPWHCWVCNKKGRYLLTLFKKVNTSFENFQELKSLVKIGSEVEDVIIKTLVKLPNEFLPILESKDIIAKHALAYLKNRNITKDDIEKYNIGYCEKGKYAKMIIIPSYDDKGNLNYFTGRSFEKDPYIKYKNPEVSRDIIPNEHLINWSLPLVICEGMFDAMAIKRNAIPLLGKNIQSALMKKIVTSTIKKIYVALDKDAQKQSLDFCKKFMDEGKEVYLIELKDKDPSEMGFKQFTNLIQKTFPLTYSTLIEKKIMSI